MPGERRAMPNPLPVNRTRKTERLLPSSLDVRTILLFLVGLSVTLSAYRSTRLSFGGFLVHPYLVLLPVLFAATGLGSLARLPRSMRLPLLTFAGVFFVALVAAGYRGTFLSELSKVIALVLTLWIVAVAPRTRVDARAGSLGICLAIAFVSLQAMVGNTGSVQGVNPFESVGERTAYSLYALPAILLAGHMAIDRWTPKIVRFIFAGSLVITVIGIFSSGNRSGYLGVVVIGVMLAARGRRPRDVVIVIGIGIGAFFLIHEYGSLVAFQARVDETISGDTSDDFRVEMLDASIRLGNNNPFLGIGPQNVRASLAHIFGLTEQTLDPHNVLGFVWAGGGLPLLAAFAWWILAWFRRPPELKAAGPASDEEKDGRALLRMMLVLLLVRGSFSQDVLWAPGFDLGIGFALGLTLQAAGSRWVEMTQAPQRKLPDLFAVEREHRRADAP